MKYDLKFGNVIFSYLTLTPITTYQTCTVALFVNQHFKHIFTNGVIVQCTYMVHLETNIPHSAWIILKKQKNVVGRGVKKVPMEVVNSSYIIYSNLLKFNKL